MNDAVGVACGHAPRLENHTAYKDFDNAAVIVPIVMFICGCFHLVGQLPNQIDRVCTVNNLTGH